MGVSTSGHNGDADLERAKDFVSQWGSDGCTAYNSYDELVANADIDIIYIGTKTKDHCKHTLLSLEAGKPVLCEKPLAENAADAASMHAKAEEKGLFMQDAMWSRFFPAVEHARLLLEEGAIGDVNSLHSDFPDPCYDFQYAPMVFGADNKPTAVVATGGGQGAARAAIAQYGSDGVAVFPLSTFTVEFPEITECVSLCPSLRVSSGRARLTPHDRPVQDLRLEGAHHARAAGALPHRHHHPQARERGPPPLPQPRPALPRRDRRVPAAADDRDHAQPGRLRLHGSGGAQVHGCGAEGVPAVRQGRLHGDDGADRRHRQEHRHRKHVDTKPVRRRMHCLRGVPPPLWPPLWPPWRLAWVRRSCCRWPA